MDDVCHVFPETVETVCVFDAGHDPAGSEVGGVGGAVKSSPIQAAPSQKRSWKLN